MYQSSGSLFAPIRIDECDYVAQGTVRLVYSRVDWPSVVIKLVKPELIDQNVQFKSQKFYKKFHKFGVYRGFAREMAQYLTLCRQNQSHAPNRFPIAMPFGYAMTDQGLAMVSERIADENGGLAPSIANLVRAESFGPRQERALEKFFDDCARYHIVFGEVNWRGIVYTECRSGEPEFVLVDGIGEKNLIPLKTWFKRLNDRNIRAVQQRIHARMRQGGYRQSERGEAKPRVKVSVSRSVWQWCRLRDSNT